MNIGKTINHGRFLLYSVKEPFSKFILVKYDKVNQIWSIIFIMLKYDE